MSGEERAVAQDGPGEPLVSTHRNEDAWTSRVEVHLTPGQSIVATREPIWFSAGLAAVPHGSATRWEASAEDMLCFAIDTADVVRLDLRKAPYAGPAGGVR